jgi:hypothetical protein
MVDVAAAAERVIFLRMRFAAYQALLEELGDDAGARMAYNGEALELMSPSADHERYNRLLEGLLRLLSLEWIDLVDGPRRTLSSRSTSPASESTRKQSTRRSTWRSFGATTGGNCAHTPRTPRRMWRSQGADSLAVCRSRNSTGFSKCAIPPGNPRSGGFGKHGCAITAHPDARGREAVRGDGSFRGGPCAAER